MEFQAVLGEIQNWPSYQRIRLIEAIWDGLADESQAFEISDELKTLLDSRIQAADEHPEKVVDWQVVEARALARFKK